MVSNTMTEAWKLYERGRDYNNRLTPNQYSLVETNTEFFAGNQWLHLPGTAAMRSLPKPTFNIIKRVASLFVASLTSSGVTLRFEPLAYYDGSGAADREGGAAAFANAEVGNLLEKFKFDYRVRDALFDGARTGDYCAHFWFDPAAPSFRSGPGGPRAAGRVSSVGGSGVDDKRLGRDGENGRGEIQMELVDGINVMFGNPNDCRVESQPYILLVGRDTVGHLREEAERWRKQRAENLQSDSEFEHFTGVGGKTEPEADGESGKALYVLLYTKARGKDGETTVHVTKATRTAVVYEDVDTGLSLYPIAWGNWERQKNQYHGRALVTGLIPNQIFINTMFATAMRHLQLMAFPKTVYNADLISAWTNEVGQAVGIHGLQPGQNVSQVAYTLPGAEMSGQIFALIDKAMAYTKECLGATDAQMGNVRPDNTSALMVLQTNAEVPLENVRAGLYEWAEDIGHILLDMMGTYYGRRRVVAEREFREIVTENGTARVDAPTGQLALRTVRRKVAEPFDFSVFKRLWLNLRVDAGATTYFSEIAMTQTLDNLRRDGVLDVIGYLERLPDKLIPRKQELIDQLKSKAEAQNSPASPAERSAVSPDAGPAQGGNLSADKAVRGLPGSMAVRYESLPQTAKKAALQQGAMRSR